MTRDELLAMADEHAVGCRDLLRLGDLTVRVDCCAAWYRDLVLAQFRTVPHQHAGRPVEPARARLRVFEAQARPGLAAEVPPDGLVTTELGPGWWQISTEAIAAHVLEGDPTEIVLAVRARPEDEFAFRVHLGVTLHRALLLLERIFLHAAGIVWDGTCTAFVGDKGSGKSTLSLALGRAGAIVLGDDHLVLRRDGDRYAVSGCDREARVLPDAETHLFGGPVDAPIIELGGVRKREILLERFVRSDPYREHALDRIVFPAVGQRFRATALRKSAALVRLIDATRGSHRFSGAADQSAYLDYLAGLVEGVATFEVELSPDLSELDALVDWMRPNAR